MNPNELLSSYDYTLPPELIAQSPVIPRDSSRLLVIQTSTHHHHQRFYDLPQYLEPNDLLVLNNTRVIPARLYGKKSTGTSVEILLLEEKSSDRWLALVKPGKKLKVGSEITFYPSQTSDPNLTLTATVLERDPETGGRILQFFPPSGTSFWDILEQFGEIPFPPYVTQSEAQADQYQTIYAQKPGAVAAPTAGLHFTDELLQKLATKGIQTAEITLHVGVGTFRPVETENIREHTMHQEWIEVPQITVDKILATKAKGGRIIAIGTTSVRALEGAAQANFPDLLAAYRGKTNLFIYPGYQWQIVDGLITNFHLPKSSLLMLVSALIGRERLLSLYQEAIQENYRFYSFGDAMLILPTARRSQSNKK
ncbi:MAG: tRNA preQ1(34) S-adenosylmethionine ribosyltransferase-isomerase QueA [Snowella sp.]|nr:tRNA preQ1(34) S-adenosylmethionine ribosyltransferase-isomerase QueA [Snowella sp.]